jgi:HK97 family phage prohead protease
MEPDFAGYATKADLKCSDGRTIKPNAFAHMHGKKVPLVWQHGHNSPENILGHALLEARTDGLYAYGFFNDTPAAKHSKTMVQHEDIDSLSIYANKLNEKAKQVFHGIVREVSLVLSGANPGAKIDHIAIQHGDDENDIELLDDEAVIYSGLSLKHSFSPEDEDADEEDDEDEDDEEDEDDVAHADSAPMTVKDIYDDMSAEQQDVVKYFVGLALEDGGDDAAEHSDNDEGIAHQEGSNNMGRNVFEDASDNSDNGGNTISHSDLRGILEGAKKLGTLKQSMEAYALQHGIESIETLFPDAQALSNTPEFNKRRTEWVAGVIDGVRHTPFSRIKTLVADITQDEARAKGYITGHFKKEEWFGVTKRTTGPTTIYKKQKLDRDQMLDITEFDVVAWLKAEMRIMLEEEIARAILVGDGRDVSDEDKIKDPGAAASGDGIRSILTEHELYATTLLVNVVDGGKVNYETVVDAVLDGFEQYKGTGTPDFYTTIKTLNLFLKAKDLEGRRYYRNRQEVAEALGVNRIITVEPMNEYADLIGIIVNLEDYNIGTDKGGEVNLFDDFDIDYNQFKYLMETRLSGALTKIKAALVIKKLTDPTDTLVAPQKPAFNSATGVITVPAQTGVIYKNGAGTTLTAGAQTALAAGASLVVNAIAAADYYFASNANDSWTFKRPAA